MGLFRASSTASAARAILGFEHALLCAKPPLGISATVAATMSQPYLRNVPSRSNYR